MKTRKPLGEKELHKLEETRAPWAEAIAGLKSYKLEKQRPKVKTHLKAA